MASAHEIALLRRAAKIETYRREYLRFAREQQTIIDKDGVLRYFELFPTQQMVEHVINEQYKEFGWIRIMEFKARQHGGSTHGVSRACHRVFLNENVSALILAQDDTTASNLFDMAGRMYDSMDKDIKPVRRYLTKQEIVLENPDVKTRSDFPGLRSRMAIQSAKNMHAGVGTTRTWLHICLDPSTPVVLDDGRFVPIIDVPVGASVMTHGGAHARVRAKSIRPAEEVSACGLTYRISPWMTYAPIVATPDHKIWTQRGWVPARELTGADYIGVPRRMITRSITSRPLPEKPAGMRGTKRIEGEVELNHETGFFFGYYLSEGSLRSAPHGPAEVRLTHHRNERPFAARAIAAVRPWIHSSSEDIPNDPDNQRITTRVYGNSLARLLLRDFGSKDEKRIPDWVFDAGADFIRGLLIGYCAGDGSKAVEGPNARVVSITSVRPSLLVQLRNILAALGWGWAALYQRNEEEFRDARGWRNRPAWVLCIAGAPADEIRQRLNLPVGECNPKHRMRAVKYVIDGGHIWVKIRAISETRSRDVCDLEIDHDDHSFETLAGAVKNSEMCRFGNVKELMGSLVPAIPLRPNTAIINESAPFGYGEGRNSFRANCDAAKSGKSPYRFVGIYWWMCPEYFLPLNHHDLLNGRFRVTVDERRLIKRVQEVSRKELGKEVTLTNEQLKYRRIRIQELGQGDDSIGAVLFQQQFPSDYEEGWVTFVNLVFEPYRIEKMRKLQERGPLRRCDIINDEVIDLQTNAPLWIWEDPQPGELYDMGVDTGQGNGGNASAFQVFKRSNNEQVAEYQNNKIAPLDYAKVIYSVGLYYNGAHAGVEVEGIGYAVNEALNQMGYPNIYRWRKRDHAGGGILSPLTGWKTQYDTKRLLVAVAQDRVAHDAVIIHSSRLYGELRYFCQDFSDAGAEVFYASEGDDDLSMAFMITETIMRDEQAIEFPMEKGAQLDRIPTLAERNKKMQEGIEMSNAFVDNADQEQFRREDDPWTKFARAMQGKD